MDEFKKVYSNEATEEVAIPFFWERFDCEGYSIWYSEYKYSDELQLCFMSSNLIGGEILHILFVYIIFTEFELRIIIVLLFFQVNVTIHFL